ncbi:phosphopantetheine-binding protein, partial [Kitasatospora sp. NPDC057198]|uniref:phosphopantetheine-binding protein n=1 Tax=Kitasatospora sp. NPDC057198 TaxID=3346046 RepID=UPI0036373DB7
VTAAAALAGPRPDGGHTVVAVAETPDGTPDLPDTPWTLLRRTALPRTPDGRPDRDALLALARKALDQDTDREAPDPGNDPLLGELVGIWQQLLTGTEATAHTDFFASGGHSLLAAVLAQKVEELTGTALELGDVFKHPTPTALAARLRA